MHDSLAGLLAKGRLEVLSIMFTEEVASYRLASVFVHTLKDLVTGGIA